MGKWAGEKLRQLGSLVKGLDLGDIEKLSKEAFEQAVGDWGQYFDVDMETLEALARKVKEVRSGNLHYLRSFSLYGGYTNGNEENSAPLFIPFLPLRMPATRAILVIVL